MKTRQVIPTDNIRLEFNGKLIKELTSEEVSCVSMDFSENPKLSYPKVTIVIQLKTNELG